MSKLIVSLQNCSLFNQNVLISIIPLKGLIILSFLFEYLDDSYSNDNYSICKYSFFQALKITISLIFITTLKDTCYHPHFWECQGVRITKTHTAGKWQKQNVRPVSLIQNSLILQRHMNVFSMMLVVIWRAQQDPFLYILRDTSPLKIKQVILFFAVCIKHLMCQRFK